MRALLAKDIFNIVKTAQDAEIDEIDMALPEDFQFEDASAGGSSVDEESLPDNMLQGLEDDVEQVSGYRSPIRSSYLNIGQFSPGVATDPRHKGGHNGIDFMAPKGTPVYAIAPGIVTNVSSNPMGGNTVNTSHEDGKVTAYYAHMDDISVSKGDVIDYDTIVGHVSNTGNAQSTCPHLHFQMWENGQLINPASKFSVDAYNHDAVQFATKNNCAIRTAFLEAHYALIKGK